MNTWTYVVGSATIIGLFITIILIIQSSIDKKIDDKVNDPNFIKKLAIEVRLPFLIFDENNRILADFGAYQHLKKVEVKINEKNELVALKISPKHFMNIAPIIENINGNLDLLEPERTEGTDWLIKVISKSYILNESSSNEVSLKKFKLTIIK